MDAQIVGGVAVGIIVGYEGTVIQSERVEVAVCAILGSRAIGLDSFQV